MHMKITCFGKLDSIKTLPNELNSQKETFADSYPECCSSLKGRFIDRQKLPLHDSEGAKPRIYLGIKRMRMTSVIRR